MKTEDAHNLVHRHQANSLVLHGEIKHLPDAIQRLKAVYTKLHAAAGAWQGSGIKAPLGRRYAQLAAVCIQTLQAIDWGDLDELARVSEQPPPDDDATGGCAATGQHLET